MGATFLVIRILAPADYGLFAMAQVVLILANMLNGMGSPTDRPAGAGSSHAIRQVFGMLIAANARSRCSSCARARRRRLLPPARCRAMLRVQALLYVATPLIALPYALLARRMEFRQQAQVNIVASLLAAATALGGALAGFGVWTLVFAPIVLFGRARSG